MNDNGTRLFIKQLIKDIESPEDMSAREIHKAIVDLLALVIKNQNQIINEQSAIKGRVRTMWLLGGPLIAGLVTVIIGLVSAILSP
jgi:hypothetical protein